MLTARLRVQGPDGLDSVCNQIRTKISSAIKAGTGAGFSGSNLNRALGGGTVAVGAGSAASYNQAASAVNKLSSAHASLAKNSQLSSRMMSTMVRDVATLTGGMITLHGALIAVGRGFETFKTYDESLGTFAQVARSSVEDVKSLGTQILNMSKKYGVSNELLSGAASELLQAGRNVQQVKAVVPTLALLGTNSQVGAKGLEEASKAMIVLGNTFKMGEGQLSQAFQKAVKLAKDQYVTVEELTQGITILGNTAATTGTKYEEMIAIMAATKSQAGRPMNETARAMNTFINNLTSPQNEAKLRKMGVNVFDNAGNFRGIMKLASEISNLRDELGETSQKGLELNIILGGIRRSSLASAMLSSMDQAKKNLASISGDVNELNSDWERVNERFYIQWNKTVASLKSSFISLMDDSPFGSLAKDTLVLVGHFANMVSTLRDLLPILGAIGAYKLGGLLFGGGKGAAAGSLGFAGNSNIPIDTMKPIAADHRVTAKRYIETVGRIQSRFEGSVQLGQPLDLYSKSNPDWKANRKAAAKRAADMNKLNAQHYRNLYVDSTYASALQAQEAYDASQSTVQQSGRGKFQAKTDRYLDRLEARRQAAIKNAGIVGTTIYKWTGKTTPPTPEFVPHPENEAAYNAINAKYDKQRDRLMGVSDTMQGRRPIRSALGRVGQTLWANGGLTGTSRAGLFAGANILAEQMPESSIAQGIGTGATSALTASMMGAGGPASIAIGVLVGFSSALNQATDNLINSITKEIAAREQSISVSLKMFAMTGDVNRLRAGVRPDIAAENESYSKIGPTSHDYWNRLKTMYGKNFFSFRKQPSFRDPEGYIRDQMNEKFKTDFGRGSEAASKKMDLYKILVEDEVKKNAKFRGTGSGAYKSAIDTVNRDPRNAEFIKSFSTSGISEDISDFIQSLLKTKKAFEDMTQVIFQVNSRLNASQMFRFEQQTMSAQHAMANSQALKYSAIGQANVNPIARDRSGLSSYLHPQFMNDLASASIVPAEMRQAGINNATMSSNLLNFFQSPGGRQGQFTNANFEGALRDSLSNEQLKQLYAALEAKPEYLKAENFTGKSDTEKVKYVMDFLKEVGIDAEGTRQELEKLVAVQAEWEHRLESLRDTITNSIQAVNASSMGVADHTNTARMSYIGVAEQRSEFLTNRPMGGGFGNWAAQQHAVDLGGSANAGQLLQNIVGARAQMSTTQTGNPHVWAELNGVVDRNIKALEALADTSTRLRGIEEERARAEKNISGKMAVGEEWIGGGAEGRQKMMQDALAAKKATNRGGFFNMSDDEAQAALRHLNRVSDIEGAGGLSQGGATGKELKQHLIGNTLGMNMGLGNDISAKQGAENRIMTIMQQAAEAQAALAQAEQTNFVWLVGQLDNQFKQFLAGLAQIYGVRGANAAAQNQFPMQIGPAGFPVNNAAAPAPAARGNNLRPGVVIRNEWGEVIQRGPQPGPGAEVAPAPVAGGNNLRPQPGPGEAPRINIQNVPPGMGPQLPQPLAPNNPLSLERNNYMAGIDPRVAAGMNGTVLRLQGGSVMTRPEELYRRRAERGLIAGGAKIGGDTYLGQNRLDLEYQKYRRQQIIDNKGKITEEDILNSWNGVDASGKRLAIDAKGNGPGVGGKIWVNGRQTNVFQQQRREAWLNAQALGLKGQDLQRADANWMQANAPGQNAPAAAAAANNPAQMMDKALGANTIALDKLTNTINAQNGNGNVNNAQPNNVNVNNPNLNGGFFNIPPEKVPDLGAGIGDFGALAAAMDGFKASMDVMTQSASMFDTASQRMLDASKSFMDAMGSSLSLQVSQDMNVSLTGDGVESLGEDNMRQIAQEVTQAAVAELERRLGTSLQ